MKTHDSSKLMKETVMSFEEKLEKYLPEAIAEVKEKYANNPDIDERIIEQEAKRLFYEKIKQKQQ